MLCTGQVYLKLALWITFKSCQFLFCNYIPLEIGVWLKLIPFIQEFQRNWSSGSGEKDENVECLQEDG